MKTLIIILAVLIFLILLEIYRELHCFKVKEYVVESERFPEIYGECNVVFLSDLHNHVYGKENEELLKTIKNAEPDLILIGGDMLVGKVRFCYEPALQFVKSLAGIAPVYYANGNHEQRMKEKPDVYCCYPYREYKEVLEKAGVHFLENESVYFPVSQKENKKHIKITGLEIPLHCYQRLGKGSLEMDEITERIGEKEPEIFHILMAHNPSYMKIYKEWGADLILSGHLHGGIARIPGITGVIAPSLELFPKYSGDIYREGDINIIVSKGLGTHTINMRFLNPAEMIIIRLRNKSCRK